MAIAPATQQSALDQDVVNLAKAIRETETRGQKDPYTAKGASGEFGAYQYTKGTWAGDAEAFLGKDIPLEQADRETQNEVAYKKLKSLKDQGYNPGQIASIWNSGGPEWEGKVGVNKYGVKYDVPKYVNAVTSSYQTIKKGGAPVYKDTASTVGREQYVTQAQMADENSGQKYGAFFPAVTGDSPVAAGLKAAGNMIPSAFHFAKGAVQSLNPIAVAKNLAKIPGEVAGLVKDAGGAGNALKAFGSALPGAAYETLVPEGARQAIGGDFEGAARTFTNDPFGQVAPFALTARGGAALLDRTKATTGATAAFDSTVSKISDVATAPARYAFGKASNAVSGTAKYAVAKTSGLNPETISNIVENPKAFTPEAMASLTRKSLGDEVAGKLNERSEAIAETGKEYGSIRALRAEDTTAYTGTTKAVKAGPGGESIVYNLVDAPNGALSLAELRQKVALLENEPSAPASALKTARTALETRSKAETVPHTVKVKANDLDRMIKDTTGLAVEKGQLRTTGSASIRDSADVRALQNFYNTWGPEFAKGNLTTTEYLNMRADLAKLAKFERELTESAALENLSGIMRAKFNEKYRKQIPGLEELDAKFGPMAGEFNTLKKGFIDKDGNLTDAAINRIANAGGKGKDLQLARLEEIAPGITQKIRTLKAIEDIQNIHKVGTYTKAAIEGGGLVGGIATGNLPLIAGSIVAIIFSQPEAAVRMIRAYGNTKALAGEVLKQIGAGTTAALNKDVRELNVSAGLSMKDVSGGKPSAFGKKAGAPQTLEEQAKMHKSAEDFVKAQTPVFRGSESQVPANRLRAGATKEYTGTAFSRQREQAQKYGDLMLAKYMPEDKILTPKDVSPEVLKQLRKEFDALDVTDADTIPVERVISKVMDIAKQNGKDAADIAAFFKGMAEEAEIRVLNTDGLKTRSQLIGIYNKANGKTTFGTGTGGK